MTWKVVVLLSVACGVAVGLLMLPDILSVTSLRQPGISFEFWVLAALFVILNCKKPVEAGLKAFVFFLISQPLIYLVQVPFSQMGWNLFSYYPRWGIITLLTLPAGMLAFFAKKQNFIGVAVISAANLVLCMELPSFVKSLVTRFPNMLLAVAFIVFEIVFFAFLLFDAKKHRIAVLAIAAIMLAVFAVLQISQNKTAAFTTELDGKAPFEIVSETPDAEVKIDGNKITVKAEYYCSFPIDVKDADGNMFTLEFSYGESGASWKRE